MFVMDAINWLMARPVLCLLIFMFLRSMYQSRQPFPEAGGRTKGAHSTAEFDGFVKDGLTLVDFYATWCPPCRASAPAFSQVTMNHSAIFFAVAFGASVLFGSTAPVTGDMSLCSSQSVMAARS